MCGQIGRLGTMEAEEIYINQEARMQAAAFKDKQRGAPANKKGVDDPAYENITLTFRNRDQPKDSRSPPKIEARSRPSLDSAHAPHWLQRAIVALYFLLALFSIILLAWVLVKISISARECQEGQKQGWSNIQKNVSDVKQHIATVKSSVDKGLKTLSAGALMNLYCMDSGAGESEEDIGEIKTQSPHLNKREDMEALAAAWRTGYLSGWADTRATERHVSGITGRAPRPYACPPQSLRTWGLLRRRKAARPSRRPQFSGNAKKVDSFAVPLSAPRWGSRDPGLPAVRLTAAIAAQ
ncbi:mast cell-expressed membrane protein 1 [Rhynchonycteris naso]